MYTASNGRTEQRSNVILNATLHDGTVSNPIRLTDLSPRGAMVEGPDLPACGTSVRLNRGRYAVTGRVMWRRGRKCGLRFEQDVDVATWRLAESEQPVERAIDSLPIISAALDQVYEKLAGTPGLLIQCGDELAQLDALASSLRRLAGRRIR